MDLRSRVDVIIEPGGRCLVPTGIAIALRPGFAAFVHPRSGIAIRHGVTILNAPGTIDAGYRGEISVILVNHDPAASFSIARGDRIAQLVITSVESAVMVEVSELPGSHRGGGFGSTGGFIGTVVP
jgi:dUTP pyrophosphatase